MRRIAWWLILIIVLFTGAVGLYNGLQDYFYSNRFGARLLAVAVTIYGVAGLVSFFGLIGRRSWAMLSMIIWASAISFAGTFASIYFSPPEARLFSGLGAGITCVALMGLILIQVHREMSRY